jgi:hypothetical protein
MQQGVSEIFGWSSQLFLVRERVRPATFWFADDAYQAAQRDACECCRGAAADGVSADAGIRDAGKPAPTDAGVRMDGGASASKDCFDAGDASFSPLVEGELFWESYVHPPGCRSTDIMAAFRCMLDAKRADAGGADAIELICDVSEVSCGSNPATRACADCRALDPKATNNIDRLAFRETWWLVPYAGDGCSSGYIDAEERCAPLCK